MTKGHVMFVLHFHLPWVLGHGKWPHGEDWLNEAAGECYLPLLQAFHRLADSGRKNCATIGITPVLTEQLASPDFAKEFVDYIDLKVEAASKDEDFFGGDGQPEMAALAFMWKDYFARIKKYFVDDIKGDVIGEFKSLQDRGVIEIITSAATHGYLPLLVDDGAINGQVRTGVENYKRRYGRAPRGFWMPECAYRPRIDNWEEPVGEKSGPRSRPGIEKFLRESRIEYTLVDTHMIKEGVWRGTATWPPVWMDASGDPFGKTKNGLPAPMPRRGVPPPYDDGRSPYRPYEIIGSGKKARGGTCVFVRDPQTSMQVWSGMWGYPGDGRYLEFHKKHWPGGHRYWRVTDSKADLGDKLIYNTSWAGDAIGAHVDHFLGLVGEVVESASAEVDAPPAVVCPFDAELFGHWWFEGPRWLEAVIDKLSSDTGIVHNTLGAYIDENPPTRSITLPVGSWGEGGDFRVWLNSDTLWTWEKLYEIERRMKSLVAKASKGNPVLDRVMEQIAREQMLLEASDWQFLMTTGTARDYAEQRLANHYSDTMKLADIAESIMDTGNVEDSDMACLEDIEKRDYCFKFIDTDWWK